MVVGDTSKLIMACAACLLGYGEVGLWLRKESVLPGSWVVLEGNPYKQWMAAHTTGFMSDFHDVRKLPEAIGLITADNRSKVFITHVGTVLLKHTNEDNVTQITKLEPVYYQAHSSHRLLSQAQFCNVDIMPMLTQITCH